MKKILVTGSMAYDRIMNFPGYFKDNILPEQIHNLNVSFFVDEFRESYGGTAGNIAYNLNLLNTNFTTWANVGEDFKNYKQWFLKIILIFLKLKFLKTKRPLLPTLLPIKLIIKLLDFFPAP